MNKAARIMMCGVLAAGLLAGCGEKEIDMTQPAITVDDETISLGEAAFFLRAQQAETLTMMQMYGFVSGNSFWSQTSEGEDGKTSTYGEQLKTTVRDELAQYVLLRRHAADYDVELPETVTEAAATSAKSIYESNTETLEEMGTTEEDIREVMELYAYPELMMEPMTADVDLEVTDEEAAQSRVIYVRTRLQETGEDGTTTDASDETKAEYKADLEELLGQMQEAGEVDEDSVREMADAIDEENIMVGATSYGEGDAYLPQEVLDAAAALQDGETYGEVIETSDGYYYLVHMLAVLDRDATDLKKNTIASERQQEAFDEMVQEWVDAADISTGENWESLTVQDSEVWVAS